MVDPFTIGIVLSIIASSLLIVVLSIALVRSGEEIIDDIKKYVQNKRYRSLIISRDSSLSAYIAMCMLFTQHRKDIKCREWFTLDISFGDEQAKTYIIPDGTVKLKLEGGKLIIIVTSGHDAKFEILYKDAKVLSRLITKMGSEYLTPEAKKSMLEMVNYKKTC